jgi:hypothetical protein
MAFDQTSRTILRIHGLKPVPGEDDIFSLDVAVAPLNLTNLMETLRDAEFSEHEADVLLEEIGDLIQARQLANVLAGRVRIMSTGGY